MKSFILAVFNWLIISSFVCKAQSSDWKVEPSAYSHSMTVVGIIKVDKNESRNAQDKVAAFINGECRGVTSPVYQEELDRYFVYLLVYNNGGADKVTFQFFSSEKNTTFTAVDSFNFVVDSLAGGVDAPYIWSNTKLNHLAEITSFSFPEKLSWAQFSDSSIYVSLKSQTQLTNLQAQFELSEGASLWIGLKQQRGGITSNDFSKPVKYLVFSEDGKQRKEYWVKVTIDLGIVNHHFRLYPNPAENLLYLEVPSLEPVVEVQLTSIAGLTYVKKSTYRNREDQSLYQIDISDVPSGLYFLAVNHYPFMGIKKLIIK